jgi:hypothetical protein
LRKEITMGRFTVIPQNTFSALQLDAGVLLKRFDPSNPVPPADADIICATTGGVNPSCVPSFSDMGDDVDNVPANMKELKKLDSWECKISTTSLGTSPELIRLALGCADVDSNNTARIIPRADLKQTDFSDIWWVGDRADGGLVAVQLKNALATSGFSLQTTKNGKGQIGLELTGHVSMSDQKTVPMVFYSMDPTEGVTYSVTQILAHVTSTFVDAYATGGDAFEATLTAETDYEIASVIVTMAGEDVTSTAWDSATGKVEIASVAGDINIVATATEGA